MKIRTTLSSLKTTVALWALRVLLRLAPKPVMPVVQSVPDSDVIVSVSATSGAFIVGSFKRRSPVSEPTLWTISPFENATECSQSMN